MLLKREAYFFDSHALVIFKKCVYYSLNQIYHETNTLFFSSNVRIDSFFGRSNRNDNTTSRNRSNDRIRFRCH